MKVGLYPGGGQVVVAKREKPACPPGGLLVRTEACGLCSGELMTWYMDGKAPHVLGHECCGIIEESDSANFPVGHRVFVHHHAPCMVCETCLAGAFVHCAQWKQTRLDPGGMAEYYACAAENLNDAFLCDDLAPEDAALIEPLACVIKSIQRMPPLVSLSISASARELAFSDVDDEAIGRWSEQLGNAQKEATELNFAGDAVSALLNRHPASITIIGAGALGLMHGLMLKPIDPTMLDINPERAANAQSLGFRTAQDQPAQVVFVLPGTPNAIDLAIEVAKPNATIVLFAPLPPNTEPPVSAGERAYFKDLTFAHSYSCGPLETRAAYEALKKGQVRAKDLVSDFIGIDDLPAAYERMKSGEILKAMVMFP